MIQKCPFCGEKKYIEWQMLETEESKPNYLIQCLICGAKGPKAISRVEAQEQWNRRKR